MKHLDGILVMAHVVQKVRPNGVLAPALTATLTDTLAPQKHLLSPPRLHPQRVKHGPDAF